MRHILKIHRSLLDPIPTQTHSYTIRTFDIDKDKEGWLTLNNKIFAHHPDQGDWAIQDLETRINEPWFDPLGFFLAVEKEKILGFCWTKIHDDLTNHEPVGELYVVGVDPEHTQKGIARATSIAALNYLTAKRLKHAMLYVDADNVKGLGLYTKLGFN